MSAIRTFERPAIQRLPAWTVSFARLFETLLNVRFFLFFSLHAALLPLTFLTIDYFILAYLSLRAMFPSFIFI